jgi:hypothetical protein
MVHLDSLRECCCRPCLTLELSEPANMRPIIKVNWEPSVKIVPCTKLTWSEASQRDALAAFQPVLQRGRFRGSERLGFQRTQRTRGRTKVGSAQPA